MNRTARSAGLGTTHDRHDLQKCRCKPTNPYLLVSPSHIHHALRKGGAVSPVKCQSPEVA